MCSVKCQDLGDLFHSTLDAAGVQRCTEIGEEEVSKQVAGTNSFKKALSLQSAVSFNL